MQAPATIANAARERLRNNAQEIEHSLDAIAAGRPGDAETDMGRRAAVIQRRTGESAGDAARTAAKAGPEAVWGQTIDFVDASFFERGLIAAKAVCRIVTRNGRGIGTGFMISPRLLITNNHVMGSEAAAGQLLAEFDYERDRAGVPRSTTQFEFAPQTLFVTNHLDDLDYAIVAVAGRAGGNKELSEFGFLGLSGARNKHALGDFVNIIQHPDARMKEAVVRENQLVGRPKGGTVLHYVADTEPGSSGSPVLNVMFNVVALHHWGGPHRELFDEKGTHVPRTVNEGIRASAICLDLQTRMSSLPQAKRALLEDALKVGMEPVNGPHHDPRIGRKRWVRTAADRRVSCRPTGR
jgi:endonuclease G